MSGFGVRRCRSIAWLAAGLVLAATAGGCGGRASAGDIHAPVPTLEPTSVPVFEAALPVAAGPEVVAPGLLDVDVVRVFFEEFEDVRAAVMFDGGDVGGFERWAAAGVVGEVLAVRDRNAELVSGGDPAGVVGSNTFENVLGLGWLDERLAAFTSCSEVHEELVGGGRTVRFVDHRVVLDASSEPWRVVEREVRHDGGADGGLSCVAPSFVERSLVAVDVALPAADAALADPAAASAAGLDEIFGGRIAEELNQIIAMQIDAGMSRVSGREFRSEVVGMDPSQPDFMIVVSVCSHYPEGIVNESATGEREPVVGYEPGSSEEDLLYVWLEPIRFGGATVAGIEPGVSRDCWES